MPIVPNYDDRGRRHDTRSGMGRDTRRQWRSEDSRRFARDMDIEEILDLLDDLDPEDREALLEASDRRIRARDGRRRRGYDDVDEREGERAGDLTRFMDRDQPHSGPGWRNGMILQEDQPDGEYRRFPAPEPQRGGPEFSERDNRFGGRAGLAGDAMAFDRLFPDASRIKIDTSGTSASTASPTAQTRSRPAGASSDGFRRLLNRIRVIA